MEKGKLYVVEGACDGMGKTTQFTLLKERLEKDGELITNHHFPTYDTYQGKPVEMYLSGEYGSPKELSPYFVNGLYAMDRAITWHTKLKEKYEAGNIILLDRYTTSSLIYQAALIEDINKRKDFVDYVCDFEYEKLGTKIPDKVIFLHAPFELVTEIRNRRTSNDGIENDIHERDLEFMKKVYDNAMFIADYLKWDSVNCSNGDSLKTIEEIHQDVYKRVRLK